jgi:hypothetical protein
MKADNDVSFAASRFDGLLRNPVQLDRYKAVVSGRRLLRGSSRAVCVVEENAFRVPR